MVEPSIIFNIGYFWKMTQLYLRSLFILKYPWTPSVAGWL